MSQEKVARYKEEKANRKTLMKKAKRKAVVGKTITAVVLVAVIGWVGYSAYDKYDENRPRQSATIDYTAFSDYLSSLAEAKEAE